MSFSDALWPGLAFSQAALAASRSSGVALLSVSFACREALLQPLLLFFLVENRGEHLVGMLHVTAYIRDILALMLRVAQDDGAFGDGRLRGGAVVAFAI